MYPLVGTFVKERTNPTTYVWSFASSPRVALTQKDLLALTYKERDMSGLLFFLVFDMEDRMTVLASLSLTDNERRTKKR